MPSEATAISQAADLPTSSIGGKAEGLARLMAAGLPVPEGFVIPLEAFQQAAEAAGADPAELDADSVRAIDLSPDLAEIIADRYAALGQDVAVAVRSSAPATPAPAESAFSVCR